MDYLYPPELRPDEASTLETGDTEDWRDYARSLDIDGHDIWIWEEPQTIDRKDGRYYTPATFFDLDPDPRGPDLDVWPLEQYDPGTSEASDSLILLAGDNPEPHVAWVTSKYIIEQYGYDPCRVEIDVETLPPWQRPDNAFAIETVPVGPGTPSMTLTEDRSKAIQRLARLWNGEVVQGQHLLRDKCPAWKTIFGDLAADDLRRLFKTPSESRELILKYRDHKWFQPSSSIFLRPQYILKKHVWYSPTLTCKTLANKHNSFPKMRGDPFESLHHRVSVGLGALYEDADGLDVETYVEINNNDVEMDDYVVDLLSRGHNVRRYLEVITGHQKWTLHRGTYRKLQALSEYGDPVVVFESLGTARKVINHWLNQGLADLPTGTFNSLPSVEQLQSQFSEAYADPDVDWIIQSVATTDWLWRQTLGDGDEYNVSGADAISLDW